MGFNRRVHTYVKNTHFSSNLWCFLSARLFRVQVAEFGGMSRQDACRLSDIMELHGSLLVVLKAPPKKYIWITLQQRRFPKSMTWLLKIIQTFLLAVTILDVNIKAKSVDQVKWLGHDFWKETLIFKKKKKCISKVVAYKNIKTTTGKRHIVILMLGWTIP